MAVEFIGSIIRFDRDSQGTERLALIILSNYAEPDGFARPGIGKIALGMGCSESVARNALQRLEAAHRIVIVPNGGTKTTSGKTNGYWIVDEKLSGTYEQLCKKADVTPVPFNPLKKTKQGGNNPKGKNGREPEGGEQSEEVLNSTPHDLLNSTPHDLLNSTPNTSVSPSVNPTVFSAFADNEPATDLQASEPTSDTGVKGSVETPPPHSAPPPSPRRTVRDCLHGQFWEKVHRHWKRRRASGADR